MSPSDRYHLESLAVEPASQVMVSEADDREEPLRRWDGVQYVRDNEGVQVTASAVVVLKTGGGFFDSGDFPNGFLAGDGFPASVYAGGHREDVRWVRKGLPSAPVVFERLGGSGMLKERKGLIAVLVASYACSVLAREGLHGTILLVVSDLVAVFGTLLMLADLGATAAPASSSDLAPPCPAWAARLREIALKGIPGAMFVFLIPFGMYRMLANGLVIGVLLTTPYVVAWAGGQTLFRMSLGVGLRSRLKPRHSAMMAVLTLALSDLAGGTLLTRLWREELWNLPIYGGVALLTLLYSVTAWLDSGSGARDAHE